MEISKKAIESLKKLQEHNQYVRDNKTGILTKAQVKDNYFDVLPAFAKEVIETREGKRMDSHGRPIAAYDISFQESLKDFFGIGMQDFFKQMEIYTKNDTMFTMARALGYNSLGIDNLEEMLIGHSSFDGVNTTPSIDEALRWIIPEIFMAPIRTAYEGSSMYNSWIATTQNMTQRKIDMPLILRGNATPQKIGEAESIPFGTVRFGQKEAKVYKIGTGFKITDELMDSAKLNLVFEFLGEVGTDMSIAADVEALNVLVNGEQTDNSESAPVIGVTNTTTGLQYKDLKRGVARMERLKRMATRIVTSEDDGIDISLLDEFKGYAGDTKLGNLKGILGKVLNLANDIHNVPANQVMLIDPTKAMAKLSYKTMKTERRRNPQTQEDELFVTDHIGFTILRRDARVLIDDSVLYSATAGAAGGFPLYMDIDSRINESFKNLQGE